MGIINARLERKQLSLVNLPRFNDVYLGLLLNNHSIIADSFNLKKRNNFAK